MSEKLTNRAVAVDRKPMTFLESIYLWNIMKGMGITISHLFKKKPTINFPEQTRSFSKVFRGLHVLNRDAEGRENCTACGLCAVACPAEAITMEAAERLPGEEDLYREEKYAAKYEINMLRCIFAVCVKRLVQKMRFIYHKLLLRPIMDAKDLFIKKKSC
jgi:NADH-quinone oxidoreductase subunit I